jgi:hypothetical protein
MFFYFKSYAYSHFQIAVIMLSVVFVLFTLATTTKVYADTEVRGHISSSQTWKVSGSPYRVHESVFVPAGVKIQIQKGVQVIFENGAQVIVEGELEILGEVESTESFDSKKGVMVDQGADSYGFYIKGGKAYISGVKVSGGKKFVEVSDGGNLILSKSFAQLSPDSFSSVAIRQNSFANISDNTFISVNGSYTVESYDSYVDVSGNVFKKSDASGFSGSDHASAGGTGLAIYTTWYSQNVSNMFTSSISSNTFIGLKTGLEVFGNQVWVNVSENIFESNHDYGLTVYSGARVEADGNTFEKNSVGIAQYNASSTLKNNIFENNTQYALEAFGGTVYAMENWWNSSAGPYHSVLNTPGTGDIAETDHAALLYPWLFEKPKKSNCCSSVLFIPGLQGSRIYKKSFGIERMLWEPGRNGDIKNLFLDNLGISKEKGTYAKGVIDNVSYLSGYFKKDIYKDFLDRLKELKKDKIIKDWNIFAYDWRLAPSDIVEKHRDDIVKMIKDLSANSRNKKVMIVSHSYGGLVTDEILKELSRQGLAGLVDKVMLVGTPEHGSPSALAALFHGDGQSIGKGFIVSQKNARILAVNAGSTYALLPTRDDFETGTIVIRGDMLNFKGTIIRNINDLTDYISGRNTFSSVPFVETHLSNSSISPNSIDLNRPAKANQYLLERHFQPKAGALSLPTLRLLSTRNSGYTGNTSSVVATTTSQTIENQSPLKVYNIIATGIPTLSGIKYTDHCPKKSFASYFNFLNVVDRYTTPSCYLKREPLMDRRGDGTVLVGNMSKKVGYKMLLDLGKYNSIKGYNYNHTDIMSSSIIYEIFHDIMRQNSPGFYESIFLKHYDESLAIDYALYHNKEKEEITLVDQNSIDDKKGIQYISIKGDENEMSGDGDLGIRLGESASHTISNANIEYLKFGDEQYFFSDIKPVTLIATSSQLKTVDVKVGYMQSSGNIGTGGGGGSSSVLGETKNITYTFSNVLVSPETQLSVSTNPSVASSVNNNGSTTLEVLQNIAPTINLDFDGDGNVDTVKGPSNVVIENAGSSNSTGTTTSSNATSSTQIEYTLSDSGNMSPDMYRQNIRQSFARMKSQISQSNVREPYKSRYYRKVLALERKYNAQPFDFPVDSTDGDQSGLSNITSTNSFKYLQQNVASLVSVMNELSKEKRRFYVGGLRRPEASFLYKEFYLMVGTFLGINQ